MRLVLASSGASSGSAAISISPGNCRMRRSGSLIGLRTRSARFTPPSSIARFDISYASVCAHT